MLKIEKAWKLGSCSNFLTQIIQLIFLVILNDYIDYQVTTRSWSWEINNYGT